MRRGLRELRHRAVDLVADRVPESALRTWARTTGRVAWMTRRTPHGAATMARGLALLTEPTGATPGRAPGPATVAGVARRVRRPVEEVERWVELGLLTRPAGNGDAPIFEPEAVERARLLAFLRRRGVDEDELVEANRRDRLPLLLVDRSLAAQRRLTSIEAAARADVSLEFACAVWSALGMPRAEPDEPLVSRREVEALRVLSGLRPLFGEDGLLDLVSVLGRGMAQVAAAEAELFRRALERRFTEAGIGELESGLRAAAAVDLISPMTEILRDVAYRRHLQMAAQNESLQKIEEATGRLPDHVDVCIGFADIVEYTAASTVLSPIELAELSAHLLRLAEDHLPPRGVRIVKSIGDAVMFSSRDPVEAAAAAVALAGAARDAVTHDIHVGLAHGPVLPRQGDFYGRTVNVAARLCGVADPGEVLIAWPVDGVPPDRWTVAGLVVGTSRARSLKGLGRTVHAAPVRARPAPRRRTRARAGAATAETPTDG